MALMTIRTDWTRAEIAALSTCPSPSWCSARPKCNRAHHAPGEVQLCTLLSIKTGGCPEDCGYCNQSAHAETGLKATRLMDVRAVLQAAAQGGATRDRSASAWARRGATPRTADMDAVVAMVEGVRAMGLETCMTLGMLTRGQAERLAEAGLDYYNHNIDTSPENYATSSRRAASRTGSTTLDHVREAGINVCCGGIVGMGETRADRVGFVHALATLPRHPESVPVNALVPVKGTVLGNCWRIRRWRRSTTSSSCGRWRGADHDAALDGTPLGGPREHERGDAGPVLPRGRQFDLHRRQAAYHRQCRRRCDAALFARLGLRPLRAEEPMRQIPLPLAGGVRGGHCPRHEPHVAGPSPSPSRKREGSEDVQENPGRQSRRDRLPCDAHRQGDGDRDGGGLLRCRCACAARADGRERCGSARRRRGRAICAPT